MPKDHPDTGKTLGSLPCQGCGATVLLKVSRRGLPFYNCDTKDAGCGSQFFARTADAQRAIAGQVVKWNDPAKRRELIGDDALPAKARKPIEPAPDPAPPGPDPDPDPADDAAAEPDAAEPEPVAADETKRPRRKRTPPPPPTRAVRLFRFGG